MSSWVFESILLFFVLLTCLYSCLSPNLGCFQILFLQIFSLLLSLLSGPPAMLMLVHFMASHRSFRLFSHFFHFSSFTSDWIISIILNSSLILYSTCSKLSLNPASEFIIAVIVLFSFRIFLFSVSLSIFPYFSYIIFLTFITSFSYLNSLKTIALQSLSHKPAIRSFIGTDSVEVFSLNGPHFPVYLYALWILFIENRTFEYSNLVTLEIEFSPSPGLAVFC